MRFSERYAKPRTQLFTNVGKHQYQMKIKKIQNLMSFSKYSIIIIIIKSTIVCITWLHFFNDSGDCVIRMYVLRNMLVFFCKQPNENCKIKYVLKKQ